MEETLKRLRIPAHMSAYADKQDVFNLMQTLVSSLVVEQPPDPVSYLIQLLQRTSINLPRVMVLGPPAVGKHTVAKRLSAELNAVLVTMEDAQDQSQLGMLTEQDLPTEVLAHWVQGRLKDRDCFHHGWVLEGIPRTRLQALALQRAGVLPEHVDVYHETFIWPADDNVANRLASGRSQAKEDLLEQLHRHRCEVPGLTLAYQRVLKVVDADQPQEDVYQDALVFAQTHRSCRITIPRILLLGPPGSGKSHQASLLSKRHEIVNVCWEELLRSLIVSGSTLGEKVRLYVDQNNPVPEHLVLQVLQYRLSHLDCSCRGWVLHGIPYDVQLARNLQRSQYRPNRVFILEATDDVCLERITLRATDPITGQRFHAVSQPAPSSTVQNRLQTRPEDGTDTVAQRLQQYRDHAVLLKSVFPAAVYIDTEQDPISVFVALESQLTPD